MKPTAASTLGVADAAHLTRLAFGELRRAAAGSQVSGAEAPPVEVVLGVVDALGDVACDSAEGKVVAEIADDAAAGCEEPVADVA
eukprot:420112-Alexandrium_andersonii.AAC.1